MSTQLASLIKPHTANPDTPARAFTTRALIDLNRLRKNAQRILTLAAPAQVMAVVKANAYGHGAIRIVRTLQEEGINQFMVASLSEALHVRANDIEAPILVALPPLRANLPVYTQKNFLVSVSSEEACQGVLDYAQTGNNLQVHIKLDTGMNRLGLSPTSALMFINKLKQHPSIELKGIWTHLATAAQQDTTFAQQQISMAQSLVNQVLPFDGVFHVGNSSSLIHPEQYLMPKENGMYRIGGAMLGISAMPKRAREVGLLPIMTLKSHVITVKQISAGESVSYGRKWTATEDTRIAIVGAGYADGYPSAALNPGVHSGMSVSIHGHSYPVIGSICMDMFMVNLGPHPHTPPVHEGDEVVLFGEGGPDINDVASRSGRKAYEISCSISQRVERVYI